MDNHRNNMIERMDKMMNNFGMGRMFSGRDPFENDPFFKDSGFGGGFGDIHAKMDKMMGDMRR